jgi:hypothetical protein
MAGVKTLGTCGAPIPSPPSTFLHVLCSLSTAQTLSFSMGFQMIPIAIFLIYAFNQETFSLGNWFAFPEGELGWDTVSRVALCFQVCPELLLHPLIL